jgi:hypothetical protein
MTLSVLAALALLPAVACQEDLPGIRVEFKVDNDKYRPDYVRFSWLRPGRLPVDERLPEAGDFPPSSEPVIGSLFVQTVGPLREARALVATGMRGDKVVSGGWVRIGPSTGSQRRFQLLLADPLPDRDGNGVPDMVEDNCFPGPEGACDEPSDGGAPSPDGGVDSAPASADGAAHEVAADGAGTTDARGPSEEGLVGFWRFEEGIGTRAEDSSGNGNAGTLRGSRLAWAEGRGTGGSLEIPDVANHGVTVNASPSIDAIHSAFTIAAWIFRTDERNGLANILSRRSVGSGEHFALALTPDGMPRVYLNSHLSPAPPTLTGPDPIPLNQWVHLAATYDGATVHLYANGTEIGNLAVATMIRADKTFVCLGCGQNSDSAVTEALTGRLDDLRLYSRALPPGEIAEIAH